MYWKSLDFLNDLIEQIPAGIFWKDINSVFLGCNNYFARLADIANPADIIGKTDFELPWGQFEAVQYIKDDQEVMLSKKPKLDIEECQTLADGSECVLLTNKIPLFDKEGSVVGILGIFHDITRRKNMEKLLEQEKNNAQMANFAKTEFITNMSHDIRTPLTGLISLANHLYDQLECPKSRQLSQLIGESGQQLLSLLNSILDLVSADSLQENDLFCEYIDLDNIAQEIYKMHKPTMLIKNLEFKVIFSPGINFKVYTDRAKLYRVLLNLISNAIKFTSEGSITLEIQIIARTKKHADIEFSVSDTGIGIPLELQSKVFDQFYRAHPSYKELYKGHGLGLHIAQKYVEILGSRINLTSAPGAGSRFYFRMNMLSQDNEIKPHGEDLGTLNAAQDKHKLDLSENFRDLNIKVMLVEDNKIAKKMFAIFCEQLNLNLECYESVAEALYAYDHSEYDLVITDIGLPDKSGYELAQSIRMREAEIGAKPLPVVGLTAHAHYTVVDKCKRHGMQEVLHKPISIEILQNLISTYCSANPREITSNASKIVDRLNLSYHYFEKYVLFNLAKASSRVQSIATLKEMIVLFLDQDLRNNIESLSYAFENEHYDFLKDLVHKIRGGAIYCATDRLHKVSETLEQLLDAQQVMHIKTLFPVWCYILNQTILQLQSWLAEKY